ncbi:MAG: hypothetical protein KBG15_02905 [Kofleriaceae bacterium]|nr:hypothetical protein [Kofleriaceae bacterium]
MSTATISSDRPRFRQDLVAEAIEDNGARYIDVIDPDTGGEFRFFEAEYAVACAMDGERDIPGLVRWAEEELGITPSASELKSVIATLGDLGYLDASALDAPAPLAMVVEAQAPVQPPAVIDALLPPSAAITATTTDDELAPGIIVAPAAALAAGSVASSNFELGQPGAALSVDEPGMDASAASNFELGASGGSTKRTPPLPKTPNMEFGPAGATDEPSTDLTEHLAIKPADVKEAVRASQIMQAVADPSEIVMEAEPKVEAKVEPKVEAKVEPKVEAKVEPKVEAKVEPKVEAKVEPKVEAKVEPKVEAKVEPKVEAKVEPKVEAKVEPTTKDKAKDKAAKTVDTKVEKAEPKVDKSAAKAEPAPTRTDRIADTSKPSVGKAAAVAEPLKTPAAAAKKGTNKGLLAILVLAVLGGGGYLAYKYLVNKEPASDVGSANQVPQPEAPVAPPAPPPPPPPSATLAAEPMPALGLKPTVAGIVESSTAEGTDIQAGEIVVRLKGFQPLAPAVLALEKEVQETIPAEIAALEAARDAATAANNTALATQTEAKIGQRKARLTQKEGQLKGKQDELAKYLVVSPVAGKVTKSAVKGTKVSLADDVASVEAVGLTATFDVPTGANFVLAAPVTFTVKGAEAGQEKIDCSVVSFDAATNKLKVSCPGSEKVIAGTELSM